MPVKRCLNAWPPPPIVLPPQASSTIDSGMPYCRICIDYGTSNLTAHSQLVHDSLTAQTAPIEIIWLKPSQRAEHAQVTVYDTDETLLYGQKRCRCVPT